MPQDEYKGRARWQQLAVTIVRQRKNRKAGKKKKTPGGIENRP
jgi:hypothetical protein